MKEHAKPIFPKNLNIKFSGVQQMLESPFCIIGYNYYYNLFIDLKVLSHNLEILNPFYKKMTVTNPPLILSMFQST